MRNVFSFWGIKSVDSRVNQIMYLVLQRLTAIRMMSMQIHMVQVSHVGIVTKIRWICDWMRLHLIIQIGIYKFRHELYKWFKRYFFISFLAG